MVLDSIWGLKSRSGKLGIRKLRIREEKKILDLSNHSQSMGINCKEGSQASSIVDFLGKYNQNPIL